MNHSLLSQSADIWTFCHAVPPSPPVCKIPSSVTTGKTAKLSCHDGDGSPPPTYRWYKNGVPLPAEPSKISGYQNATYSLDTNLGSLVRHEFTHVYQRRARFQRRLFFQTFPRTSRSDSGEYYCEAANKAGPVQRCRAARMEVRKCCSEPPSKVNRRVFSGLTSPPCFFKVT